MAAIITEKFRLNNARQFKEDFGESASSTYMFIGRPWLWGTDDTVVTPVDNNSNEIDAYDDMVALKKITSSDVSHGIVRRDWTSGTTYDEYRHDYSSSNTSPTGASNLYDSKFYVITEDYNVYKCIRTGRDSSGNAIASDVKPTGTSSSTLVATSDSSAASGRGYLWKYMYSISASDVIKFVTNDFIPVKTIGAQTEVIGDSAAIGSAAADDSSAQWDVENDAVDGAILHVAVDSGGAGMNNGTYTSVPIKGDNGSGTDAECTVTIAGGVITHITMTTNGTGYRNAQLNLAD